MTQSKIEGGDVDFEKNDGTKTIKFRKNLHGKINGLHQTGKLTKSNADTLHKHRFLGNTAVHELSVPAKEELSLALEIAEGVFSSVYEIPLKGLELKRRRLRNKKFK